METKDYTVILGEYKGLHYTAPQITVTDSQVEQALEQERKNAGKLATIGKAAELGDTVVIDYSGFCEGIQFPGGTSSQPYPLVLGSNSFIPGFEQQLVGAVAGEERDVNVTFPEIYHEPTLAGKPAIFKCKVHAVQQMQYPALGDAFAKEIYHMDSLEALRSAIKDSIVAQMEDQEMNRIVNILVKEIVGRSTITLSEDYLKASTEQMEKYFANQLQMQGASVEMYCQLSNTTSEELHRQLSLQAEDNAKNVAVLNAIAEQESLTIRDEDLKKELLQMAQAYRMPLSELKKQIPTEQIEEIRKGLLVTKAVDFVMEHAVKD